MVVASRLLVPERRDWCSAATALGRQMLAEGKEGARNRPGRGRGTRRRQSGKGSALRYSRISQAGAAKDLTDKYASILRLSPDFPWSESWLSFRDEGESAVAEAEAGRRKFDQDVVSTESSRADWGESRYRAK